jgi:hypothetical protein
MRFNDLFDPEKGPAHVLRLATYPLILLIGLQLVSSLIRELPAVAELGFLLFLIVMSPLAFLIRERRRGRPRREGARRGAERTPLLPPNEVGQ